MARRRTKAQRWLFAGDTHCGHVGGLTPPGYWSGRNVMGGLPRRWQEPFWAWYVEALARWAPFDGAVWNGDMVDGEQRKAGGSEAITTDINEQVDIAVECINEAKSPRNLLTFGTAYHVGQGFDYEAPIARRVAGGSIAPSLELWVNGRGFHIRHHSNRTLLPYGMSATAKEQMWAIIASRQTGAAVPTEFVRSHVHMATQYWTQHVSATTLPALQLPVSRYGRRCSGDYTVGFFVADINEAGGITWHREIMRVEQRGVAATHQG